MQPLYIRFFTKQQEGAKRNRLSDCGTPVVGKSCGWNPRKGRLKHLELTLFFVQLQGRIQDFATGGASTLKLTQTGKLVYIESNAGRFVDRTFRRQVETFRRQVH